jgi:hypothetical protein
MGGAGTVGAASRRNRDRRRRVAGAAALHRLTSLVQVVDKFDGHVNAIKIREPAAASW